MWEYTYTAITDFCSVMRNLGTLNFGFICEIQDEWTENLGIYLCFLPGKDTNEIKCEGGHLRKQLEYSRVDWIPAHIQEKIMFCRKRCAEKTHWSLTASIPSVDNLAREEFRHRRPGLNKEGTQENPWQLCFRETGYTVPPSTLRAWDVLFQLQKGTTVSSHHVLADKPFSIYLPGVQAKLLHPKKEDRDPHIQLGTTK